MSGPGRGAPGIEVREDTGANMSEVGIVDARVVEETQWTCPGCGTSWKKAGVHSGKLKTCGRCGSRFFLRR
jgi:hypothetical protein